MTLAVRNTVIQFGAIIAMILFAGFVVAAYQTILDPSFSELPISLQHSWLAWEWQVKPNDVVASLAATGALGLVSAGGLLWAARVFRRVSSAEVYFVVLFLIGLAFEQLRVGELYVLKANLPAIYGTILTRAVIIARITGTFSLFVASLYAVGIDYPRIGSLTIGLGLLAFLFVYFVPVDATYGATMLHRVAGQSSLELTLLISGVMTTINYLIAAIRGHRERGFLVGAAAVSLVVGGQICFHLPFLPWLVAGVVILAYGVLTFVLVTRDHFLWY